MVVDKNVCDNVCDKQCLRHTIFGVKQSCDKQWLGINNGSWQTTFVDEYTMHLKYIF